MSSVETFKGVKLTIDPARISLAAQAQDHGGVCIVQAAFESKTKGGIIVPDSHKKPAGRFLAHSIGPTDRKHLQVIEAGQTVFVHGWARPELWFTWQGDVLAVVRLEDIEAIVSPDGSLRPIGERLVVQPKYDKSKTAGGLYIPDTVQDRPQIGTVLVAGPGTYDVDGKWVEVKAQAGQDVLYGRYCGATVNLGVASEVLIIHQEDILGVIQEAHGDQRQAGVGAGVAANGSRAGGPGADAGAGT